MRLAVLPEGPLSFDGDAYLYSEGEGIYLDNIAQYFDEVIICAYVFRRGHPYYDTAAHYQFRSPNIRIAELPLKNKGAGKYLQIVLGIETILKNIRNWDMLYIFLPGYPGAIAYVLARLFKKPYFAYLASDWPEEAHLLIPWGGLMKKVLYPFFLRFTQTIQDLVVRNSLFTLAAGSLLPQKYAGWPVRIVETIPRLNWSSLQVSPREDTCLTETIRLLFVGYLLPRKGARYAIEAVRLLRERGRRSVRLSIVGTGEQKEELKALVLQWGLEREVEFLGHIPNGPLLFDIYRTSDIFIFSSFSGEGFPRVLYEAMSQGLPVISTDICGIDKKMEQRERALLVPPMKAEAIADAVEELICDGELRRSLIRNGLFFMEEMIRNKDGGKQVYELVRRHAEPYTLHK